MSIYERFEEGEQRRLAETLRQQEAAFREAEEEQARVKEQLTKPGGVEELIVEERIPIIGGIILSGNPYRGQTEHYPVYVPPVGAKFGDTMERLPGGCYAFTSPEGQLRGIADEATFSRVEIGPFREILEAAKVASRAARPQPSNP